VKPLAGIALAATMLSVPLASAADLPTEPSVLALARVGDAEPPAPRDMGVADHITTGDRTFARLLLGGRVLLLARDSAVLTITEVPGAATIRVSSGRVAVTVDRENLHPEDLVEILTPHAVVGVPAETLVADVDGDASTFTALGAKVDVFALDPVTGGVARLPIPVGSNEAVTVARAPATDVAAAGIEEGTRR
jgi:hypothetical protein